MQIKANGISFNYRVEGPHGAPWVMMSNSLATDLTMWNDQAAALRDKFQVLRYDQRGHGETEAPAGRYTFDLLIDDARALMDALSIPRAHFVGLSMGGVTGMGLAQRYPERLDRVVICDAPCASTPATAAQWEERIVIAQQQGMEALVEPTVGRWFPPSVVAANPPYLDRVRDMIRTTPVNGFVGCAAALADHDVRSGAGSVVRPVLFVVGEKDGTTPGIMRQMHEALSGSRFVELPEAGHISNLDQPEMFTRSIRDFLMAAA